VLKTKKLIYGGALCSSVILILILAFSNNQNVEAKKL